MQFVKLRYQRACCRLQIGDLMSTARGVPSHNMSNIVVPRALLPRRNQSLLDPTQEQMCNEAKIGNLYKT